LTGPSRDVEAIEQVLLLYGFEVTKCLGPDDGPYPATRKGIMTAWQALIQQTEPSDAVVIYYSGHGGIAEAEESETGGQERRLQYIVPLDFPETKDGEWRGISDAEMIDLLHQTTDKTQNVTIILDCCHSAHMARGAATWAKAIYPDDYRHISAHVNKAIRAMPSLRRWHHEHNPNVVSIVAAGLSEPAFERAFFGRGRMGVLTEALSYTLRISVDAGLPWRDLMRRVRDRMWRTCPGQYPDVEGPQNRLPFRVESASRVDPALSVTETTPGHYVLQGGALHGVTRGDVFVVMPFGETRLVQEKRIAEAEVTRVGSTTSPVRMLWARGQSRIGPGAKAFACKSSIRLPVNLRGAHDDFMHAFRRILGSSVFVYPAEPGEKEEEEEEEEEEGIATVERRDNHVKIWHHQHYLLRDWEASGNGDCSHAISECATVLESLARARRFLDMQNNSFSATQEFALSWEVGLVVELETLQPCPRSDIALPEGSNIYISVTNTGARTFYLSIFDVCADAVSLLSHGSPSGIELQANRTYRFGEVDVTGELRGSLVSWPVHVPKVEPISEIISLIVTDKKIDLRNLETGPESAQPEKSRARGLGTPLADLVDSIAFGDLRTISAETKASNHIKYRVVNISCRLQPRFPSGEDFD